MYKKNKNLSRNAHKNHGQHGGSVNIIHSDHIAFNHGEGGMEHKRTGSWRGQYYKRTKNHVPRYFGEPTGAEGGPDLWPIMIPIFVSIYLMILGVASTFLAPVPCLFQIAWTGSPISKCAGTHIGQEHFLVPIEWTGKSCIL